MATIGYYYIAYRYYNYLAYLYYNNCQLVTGILVWRGYYYNMKGTQLFI